MLAYSQSIFLVHGKCFTHLKNIQLSFCTSQALIPFSTHTHSHAHTHTHTHIRKGAVGGGNVGNHCFKPYPGSVWFGVSNLWSSAMECGKHAYIFYAQCRHFIFTHHYLINYSHNGNDSIQLINMCEIHKK